MNKLTKVGLNAMVAFALMFATTMNVVAQEKVKASNDDVEVSESKEAHAPAASLEKLANFDTFNENIGIKGVKKVLTATYFIFSGSPGQEGDINEWTETSNGTGCIGDDRACKIKVKPEYLMEVDGEVRINPTELDEIDLVPGQNGLFNVPNPAQLGPGQPFEEIHNQPSS